MGLKGSENILAVMNELPPIAYLAAFVEVAKQGAFNEAAKVLDVSPSAASKSVSRLEAQLGVKLLHRTTRSVSLTPEGERYLEGAQKVLDDLQGLGEEVSDTVSTPKGVLRVSAPSPFARLWLVPVLAAFLQKWPDVKVELSLADQLNDLAADGLDLAIRSGGLDVSEHLVARKLYDETLIICSAPDYFERSGRPKIPDDLKQHACLNFRAPQTGRFFPWMITIDGNAERLEVDGPLAVDDGEMVLKCAYAGMGVAQLPGYMARPHIESGALIEVLEDFRPPLTQISAVYLDRRLLSPRIRVFIDHLVASARDMS